MQPRRSRIALGVLTILFASLLCGCESKFTPPSPETRQQLGKIAVFAVPEVASGSVEKPVSGAGAGALAGAGQATLGSLAGGAALGCRDPTGCILGLALGAVVAVVAAPVGAVVGSASAHSDQEVRAASASLNAALIGAKPGEQLSEQVAATTQARTLYDAIAVPAAADSQNLRNLSAGGFASALQIAVTDYRLLVSGNINPDVQLVVAVEVHLKRIADGSELYQRKWAYVGPSNNYFRMADADAFLLRYEIKNALNKLSDRIVADLFISTMPEAREPSPPPGSVVTTEAPTVQEGWTIQAPKAPTVAAVPPGPPGIDVPFSVDLAGYSYGGVAKLSNGHITGQFEAYDKPVRLSADLKSGSVTARLVGYLATEQSPWAGQCVADGTASRASGDVTMPMRASCPLGNPKVMLHLRLPVSQRAPRSRD